jgi:hypothetical protein
MTEQTPDTRPDHTEAISFIVRQHYRRVFDHARSTTERIYYKCECGAGISGGHDWHIAREIVRALLDPSNRAVLIAALTADRTDDILDALVARGVLTSGQAKFRTAPRRPGDSYTGRAG